MQRRAALLVVLVVLAGCAGPSDRDATTAGPTTAVSPTGDPTTTASPTSAPTTTGEQGDANVTTTATTTTLEPDRLPPGVTADGVENATVLVEANVAALNATGWRYHIEYRSVVEFPGSNATLDATRTKRAAVTAGMTGYRLNRTDRETTRRGDRENVESQHRETWSNGTLSLVRLATNNRTVYQPAPEYGPGGQTERESRLAERTFLAQYLGMGDYEVAAVNRTGDGSRVRLVADGASSAGTNVNRFRAIAVVDDRGRIHRFTVALEGTTNGRPTAVEGQYRLTGVEVSSVAEPGWLDAALAATNATANATTAGG